ncbi:MAG: GMC family oxidoreductase [Chloroflexi bacterium]|nr:GMC family oxidoreductase [Chloroflexota bacterium]
MHKLYWRDRRITAGDDPIRLAGNVTGKGVGGSTVHYAMYALRMHRSDFEVRSRHGLAADWPLRYEDLAPYYEDVERELGIAGPLDWPWDPPRRGAHPYRPHRLNGVGEIMAEGCERLGIRWRPGPIATLSAPMGKRPPCVYRGWCIFGCSTEAKSSTLVTYVRKAVAAGADVRPNSMAFRVNLDARGRARSVSYFRPDGRGGWREEEQEASVVIVSAYSIETPRLLLMSAGPGHPDGLANGSGLVGRNLMVHSSHMVFGRFPEPVRQYKAPPASTISQDFYESNPSNDYVRGYSIETVGPLPIQFAQLLASSLGLWGRELREVMQDYNHYAGLGLVGETLPQEANGVTLDRNDRDQYGLPIPVVTFSWHDNDQRLFAAGIDKQRQILEAAGAEETFTVDDTAHLMGACRMGDDPDRSVVDRDCRSWEVPNLYICDGSVFPTSSASNPSLTIQAVAARTADALIAAAGQRTV